MLTPAQNDRITRIGPGTPAGRLLRSYWQPVALVDEMNALQAQGRAVKPVRLMGQDLVLFRDETGRYGLLDRDCPHRGADLSYGRLESGGLRCLFHGWKFDADGRCVETPGEPAGSKLCTRIQQGAYPVQVAGEIVWGYLGRIEPGGVPPPLPQFDCLSAPSSHAFAFKGWWSCNWLQALEVGIDPVHASFLHVYFEDEDPSASYGRQFRSASSNSAMPMTQVLREFNQPELRIEKTDWGQRLITLRHLDEHSTHVRVTQTFFPQAFLIPMSDEITITQWHVPIDDTNTYWYTLFTSYGEPIDKEHFRSMRLKTYPAPEYKPLVGRHNRYGFNVEEQRSHTYTGMGEDINVHDQWACESQGPIQDRTREHLGTTDKGIISYRRMLNQAIDQLDQTGQAPPVYQGLTTPETVDGIGPRDDWQGEWHRLAAKRFTQAPWRTSREPLMEP
jgi:phenylpropionate dioxygenase-like ring-hydroxylating dioxygenase large terminal subunit